MCKTTGRTPFEIIYGYIPRFHDGLSRELTADSERFQIPQEIRDEVVQKIEIEQQKAKIRYDKSRLKNVKFNVGDIIVMKSNPVGTGESTKLQARNIGPLVITECLPSDTYRVECLISPTKANKTTANVSQLRIWKGHDDESDEETEYSQIETNVHANITTDVKTDSEIERVDSESLNQDNSVGQNDNVRRSSRIR